MNCNTSHGEPYLVVSTDTHSGPTLVGDLRAYCPSDRLDDYDRYCQVIDSMKQQPTPSGKTDEHEKRARLGQRVHASNLALEGLERARTCAGQSDPAARLADMDAEGIAADVIFAGGQNGEVLPFVEFGLESFPSTEALELQIVGAHIWNQWLADFVSQDPARHVGVMEIPIWDVGASLKEVEWGKKAGLKAVNFPAPRSHLPAYNEEVYEPFFGACEELGLPLLTHVGGGDAPLGASGVGGYAISMYEVQWLSRRAVWELILGGVFERHPGLKLVIAECRVGWISETLADLDSYCLSDLVHPPEQISRLPSEYWATNCYNSGSFLAPFEVARRHEVGVHNLMWGSDYPHVEGTWPHSRLSLRNTFAGVPEEEVRLMLGKTAVEVFSLDEQALRKVADRIGPSPADLAAPLTLDELPELRGYAFRERGLFA